MMILNRDHAPSSELWSISKQINEDLRKNHPFFIRN